MECIIAAGIDRAPGSIPVKACAILVDDYRDFPRPASLLVGDAARGQGAKPRPPPVRDVHRCPICKCRSDIGLGDRRSSARRRTPPRRRKPGAPRGRADPRVREILARMAPIAPLVDPTLRGLAASTTIRCTRVSGPARGNSAGITERADQFDERDRLEGVEPSAEDADSAEGTSPSQGTPAEASSAPPPAPTA